MTLFLLGILIGSLLGVTTACLFAVAGRENDHEQEEAIKEMGK